MNPDQEAEQKQLITVLEVVNHVARKHPEFIFKVLTCLVQTQPQMALQALLALTRATNTTALNIVREFPLFIPKSAGNYQQKAPLTLRTINQVFPFLSAFTKTICPGKIIIRDIEQFPQSPRDRDAAEELKAFFNAQGSDKSTLHNYHHIYGPVLKERDKVKGILEIGMGTNNVDVVSNMGIAGKPGASLRAFRDFLDTATVYGADVDKRILFQEERIKTFFVDQTDPASFSDLDRSIPSDLDLVIDDGLHSPDANIETLKFGLGKIRVHGWVIIEDIGIDAIPLWEVVSGLLPPKFESHILTAAGNVVVFAVRRLE